MNNFAARALYDRAKSVLFLNYRRDPSFKDYTDDQLKIYVENMRLTQSFLRMEVALATTTTQYTFAVTAQQKGSAPNNTETLLQLQDSFVCNEMGFFVGKPSAATDITFEMDTYTNLVKYTDAATALAMQGWWTAGVLQLSINNEVIIPKWDLARHMYRPQAQQQTFVSAAQTGASTNTQDQKRLGEDGFYAVEPNILFVGSKNTVPIVNLPVALTSIVASTRGIMVCRGVLAQNSTVVS